MARWKVDFQRAGVHLPGTESIEVLALASRSQVRVANIRWLSDASLGIRARQASRVSPWVPCDTRLGPVLTGLVVVDAAGDPVPVPPVLAGSISAHPTVSVARLKEANKTILESNFIGQAPPQ